MILIHKFTFEGSYKRYYTRGLDESDLNSVLYETLRAGSSYSGRFVSHPMKRVSPFLWPSRWEASLRTKAVLYRTKSKMLHVSACETKLWASFGAVTRTLTRLLRNHIFFSSVGLSLIFSSSERGTLASARNYCKRGICLMCWSFKY